MKKFFKRVVELFSVPDTIEENPPPFYRYVRYWNSDLDAIHSHGGLTFKYKLDYANHKIRFAFVYCSLDDNFSKKDGRFYCDAIPENEWNEIDMPWEFETGSVPLKNVVIPYILFSSKGIHPRFGGVISKLKRDIKAGYNEDLSLDYGEY